MARPLGQILSELNSVYDPQRQVYNSQISNLDPMQVEEQKGLEAAKQDSFQQITDTANRRGLFYSGIPIAEQQKYTGATYLPAVANLRSRYAQQRFNLQDALAQITRDQYLKGQDIWQTELSRDEAARQAAAARAGAGGASPSFGFGGGGGGGGGGAPAGASDGDAFAQYLSAQYASNPGANRKTQDSWVQSYANRYGIRGGSFTALNDYYNQLYPWERYNDQARQVSASSIPGSNKIPAFNTGTPKYANPGGLRF